MALTGHLSDLSLSELIEFFCNQRKSGRLRVLYPQGSGYFYLQAGSVIHAQIGVLRGIDAVYYALTLANAKFEFSGSAEAPERTINQPSPTCIPLAIRCRGCWMRSSWAARGVLAGSRVAARNRSMPVAVERNAPAPASAGIWNRGTGLPRRVWPTATRAACSSEGTTSVSRMPSGREIRSWTSRS